MGLFHILMILSAKSEHQDMTHLHVLGKDCLEKNTVCQLIGHYYEHIPSVCVLTISFVSFTVSTRGIFRDAVKFVSGEEEEEEEERQEEEYIDENVDDHRDKLFDIKKIKYL